MLFARARVCLYVVLPLFVLLSRLLPSASSVLVVVLGDEGDDGGDGIALTRSNGNCSILVIPTFRGRLRRRFPPVLMNNENGRCAHASFRHCRISDRTTKLCRLNCLSDS